MPQKTHTKILATIGPSSASKEQIEKLIDAGCDAFRFNFSHGTHAEHKERFEIVRKLSLRKRTAILPWWRICRGRSFASASFATAALC